MNAPDTITPEALKRALDEGRALSFEIAPGLSGYLQRVPTCYAGKWFDIYVMRGLTGEHRLRVSCTDAARLHAHFEGFYANNRAAYPPIARALVAAVTSGEVR